MQHGRDRGARDVQRCPEPLDITQAKSPAAIIQCLARATSAAFTTARLSALKQTTFVVAAHLCLQSAGSMRVPGSRQANNNASHCRAVLAAICGPIAICSIKFVAGFAEILNSLAMDMRGVNDGSTGALVMRLCTTCTTALVPARCPPFPWPAACTAVVTTWF